MSYRNLAILGISLLLAGCATNRVVIDGYCQNYSIIHPSRKDTAGTLRQVATENAKWRSVCATNK